MGLAGFISVAAFLLVGLFAAVNWAAITTPVTVSLIVTSAQAPLGLILLVAALVLGLGNLAIAMTWRTSMLVESRKLSRDLHTERDRADRVEASRLTELRADVVRELAALRTAIDDARLGVQTVQARVDDLHTSVTKTVQESANGVAASLGEVEDKLDRVLSGGPARSDRGPARRD